MRGIHPIADRMPTSTFRCFVPEDPGADDPTASAASTASEWLWWTTLRQMQEDESVRYPSIRTCCALARCQTRRNGR